jgi:hypothetical protein
LKIGGRIDFLPFGLFTNKGQFSNDIFKKGRGKTLSRNQTNQIEDF